jgi:hypothetical protein
MAKIKETHRLVLNQTIEVGTTLIEVNKSVDIITELAQLDNGAVQPIYTSKINGIIHKKGYILENAKLIWQKAQQQQK